LRSKFLTFLSGKCRESFILGNLIAFSEFLYAKASRSLFVRYITSYDETDNKFKNGLFGGLRERFHQTDAARLKAKMKFAAFTEKSLWMDLYERIVTFFLDAGVNLYGYTVFSFGFVASLIYIIKRYLLLDTTVYLSGLAAGIALMVFSTLLMLSRGYFRRSLSESFFGGAVLIGLFGFLPMDLEAKREHSSGGAIFLTLGALLGGLTFFISIEYILIALAVIIVLPIVFYKPEFGFFLIITALPFLPTMLLAGMLILVFISFSIKVLRGKRTVKFDICDISVLFFAALMFLGGPISSSPSGSLAPALLYTCFMLAYFLAVNLIRSQRQVMQGIKLLLIGLFFTSVYGIYQNFFGAESATWHDEEMFSEISKRVYSTFENPNVFGEYLILLLPLAVSLLYLIKPLGKKTLTAVVLVCGCASLIYTWSRGAWLGFIIAMMIYFLITYKNTFIIYITALAALPFSIPFLPASIVNRFTSIGDLNDTSTNYRVNIWKAVVKMIEDTFITGIGVGERAFDEIYPFYALSGIESAPHSHNLYLQITLETGIAGLAVFITAMVLLIRKSFSAASKAMKEAESSETANTSMKKNAFTVIGMICGIGAFLIMGMTDYVWYNYRVFLLFWIICGITAASSNVIRSELSKEEY